MTMRRPAPRPPARRRALQRPASPRRRRVLQWTPALALALAPALAGCMREPEPLLRIGTNVWLGSEPLYLARELGRLDARQVRLVEYPSASEVLRAYRNQAIDGMVISLDELLGLAADGLAPRIVAVADVSNGADVVVGRAGMQSMRDLAGRPVAVEGGALGAYVLARALALSDMRPGDVRPVLLDSYEQPQAFAEGRVDGAVTFDPYRSQLLASGATTLFDSTRIPGEIVDLIVVRDTSLARQPQAIQALLAGWFDALDAIARDPGEAAHRMGARQQIGADQLRRGLRLLRLPTRDENLQMLGGQTPALAASGRRLMSLMLEARLLREPVDIDAVIDAGPLLVATR